MCACGGIDMQVTASKSGLVSVYLSHKGCPGDLDKGGARDALLMFPCTSWVS